MLRLLYRPARSRRTGRQFRSRIHGGVLSTHLIAAAVSLAALLTGACAPTRDAAALTPADMPAKRQELQQEQKIFIAHEFFLRARQQEMEGNDAVALSYFQIAFEYDPASRDLCLILTERLKAADKMDSALATGLRCLELKGKPQSREYQIVAEILLRKGEINDALTYYGKALELDDQDKELLYTLATLYESLKDMAKHVEVMEKLLPKVDYPVRLVEKQVQSYRMLGRIDAVAGLYRTAWDKSGNPLFGEKLASFYEDQEMYASLLDVIRKLAGENPENLHYELQKARALVLAGKPDSALVAYEALIKRSPEDKEFLSPYGTLLFEKGRYAEAGAVFRKLIKSQPGNPVFHFFLGSVHMEVGDTALAESELKKAIDLDGKVPEYWAKLAAFYIHQGRERKAMDLLETMNGGKDWYASYVQGVVFTQVARKLENERKAEEGKGPGQARDSARADQMRRFREQGVAHFRKAMEQEGNNRRVLFELGVALEQTGKRGESIDVMKRLVKLDSGDATILNYLGYMLVEEDRELDYAGALIDRALRFEPESGAFLDSKGWWFYRKKDYLNARKYIEMALDRMPDDTTILEHYALILEKLGQSDEAMEKWRRILKLDPANEMAHRKLN